MTDRAVSRVRRCRDCGRLVHARDTCTCDTQTVHVITDLGPTDGPGLMIHAQLGRLTPPRQAENTWTVNDPRVQWLTPPTNLTSSGLWFSWTGP